MKNFKKILCAVILGFVISSIPVYALSVNAESGVATVYTTDYLRVREYPELDAEIIDVTLPGTLIERIEKLDNGWSKVIYNGKIRYMYSKYLTENSDDTHSQFENIPETSAEILPEDFIVDGIEYFGGYRWTYYSELVLPGEGLDIPGRYTDNDGYVCDESDYICLASDSLPKGTVVPTPFGKDGKIYDCGCGADDILDVYCCW